MLAVTDTAAVMEALAREAEASLDFAREVEARSQATEACVRADVAAREAERRARLLEQGVAGEEEAENARGEAEARKASCASASTAVAWRKRGRGGRAHLARAQRRRNARTSGRPSPGASWRLPRPGELIGERGILELGRVTACTRSRKSTRPISATWVGQRATVSSPALDGELNGTVGHSPKVQKQDEIGTDPLRARTPASSRSDPAG